MQACGKKKKRSQRFKKKDEKTIDNQSNTHASLSSALRKEEVDPLSTTPNAFSDRILVSSLSSEDNILEPLVKDIKDESGRKEVKLDLLKQLLQIKNKTLEGMETKETDISSSTTKNLFSTFGDIQSSDKATAKNMQDSSLQRLGFFRKDLKETSQPDGAANPSVGCSIYWFDHYFNENLKNLYDLPIPSNAYQEAIELTNQGKIFNFPINNEQGMDEEQNIPFYKHVFLESKLNEGDWCAKQGPIRNFMVAVCSSLSMNPYLSVSEKEEHIHWFRDYFIEKRQLLQQLGLVGS